MTSRLLAKKLSRAISLRNGCGKPQQHQGQEGNNDQCWHVMSVAA
jgi:hypothetical protein